MYKRQLLGTEALLLLLEVDLVLLVVVLLGDFTSLLERVVLIALSELRPVLVLVVVLLLRVPLVVDLVLAIVAFLRLVRVGAYICTYCMYSTYYTQI